MLSSFDWRALNLRGLRSNSPRFWLQAAVGALAILNAIGLYLYFDPPGGTRASLSAESQRLKTAIAAAQAQSQRLKTVSEKVQLGGQQAVDFGTHYIFAKRLAYESIVAEIQRMAQAASLAQREGAYTEEPIEGTPDLSVLNINTNFEGSYPNLMRFLFEVDRSPMLLMLDTLTASPQKPGQITAQVRFQAIIREPGATTASGGQP